MKRKKFIVFALMAAVILGFSSCSKDNDEPKDEISGAYKGTVELSVGTMASYKAENLTYVLKASGNNTIDLMVPQETYTNTVMGDLTLGSYTIKGLEYDAAKKSYIKDYSKDGLEVTFKCQKDGVTTINKPYKFKSGNIVVTLNGKGGVVVQNDYKFEAFNAIPYHREIHRKEVSPHERKNILFSFNVCCWLWSPIDHHSLQRHTRRHLRRDARSTGTTRPSNANRCHKLDRLVLYGLRLAGDGRIGRRRSCTASFANHF